MNTTHIYSPEFYFLVGIIEGEGTIQLGKGKYPRLAVKMADEDIINRLQIEFGGNIHHVTNRSSSLGNRPLFAWQFTESRKVAELLLIIYPFMSKRRQSKIDDVLATWRAWKPRPKRGKYGNQG